MLRDHTRGYTEMSMIVTSPPFHKEAMVDRKYINLLEKPSNVILVYVYSTTKKGWDDTFSENKYNNSIYKYSLIPSISMSTRLKWFFNVGK